MGLIPNFLSSLNLEGEDEREVKAETRQEIFYSQLGILSQKVVRFGFSIGSG